MLQKQFFYQQILYFGKNVTVEPYVVIGAKVKIGNNVRIKSFTHIEGAKIENNVEVGPYTRIRKAQYLRHGSKIGNFVETKKSTVGKNSKGKSPFLYWRYINW